ncbi:MAG: hypothetical protein R3F43_19650 [bacterium]
MPSVTRSRNPEARLAQKDRVIAFSRPEENIALKKRMGDLKGRWAQIRATRLSTPSRRWPCSLWSGCAPGARLGGPATPAASTIGEAARLRANEHNHHVPRDHWLETWERQAILDSMTSHPLNGHRRPTYMMMDEDIVAVSPPPAIAFCARKAA